MISKVTLRQKPISKGRESLYLDFYPPIKISGSDKTTRREFLRLSIHTKPKNLIQKQDNKQALLLAEQIRLKRDNEINKPEVYTPFELDQLKAQERGEKSFLNYYESQMKKRKGSTYQVWFKGLAGAPYEEAADRNDRAERAERLHVPTRGLGLSCRRHTVCAR